MKRTVYTVFMFICVQTNWKSQCEQVEQRPSTLSVQEGDSTVINCTYTDSTSSYFPWYKQETGKHPQLIIDIRSNVDRKQNQRLTLLLDKTAKHLSLHITATQTGDSATYFCAASGGGYNKLTFGKGTVLLVSPDIQDPKPAVYQLRDPHSKDDTICLFTDFDSRVNVSKDVSSEVFVSDKTVLDMRIMGSKSNGALAWSNQSSFDCKEAFKENASYPSSDVPCDAKLVEKSFQTDMNLNFQNLSVMGLRILLLKVAGFNLFMTLRLWSS